MEAMGEGGSVLVSQAHQAPLKVALTSSQWECVPIDLLVYCFFSCPHLKCF